MFSKILIANRGEIACRVIKTAKRMGIATAAVYSDADADALHVTMADEKVHIGPAPAAESYLLIERILAAVELTGAQAVHPGYGFLSENKRFAEALIEAGVAFIGPGVRAIEVMGDKIKSKKLAKQAGVSTVPGYLEVIKDADEAVKIAADMGYPVMLKASAGGGGKGMRVAWNDAEAHEGFISASNEAKSSFADDRVFLEKFIEQPRHIEIQVLADQHGACIYLGERECSIQRRHQKVIEEAPSPFLDAETRKAMGEEAVALARSVDYCSAGTVEFIADKDKNFYFLEMNTRLQVEHPVTEMVTGIDLVEQMIRVAAGEKLSLAQSDVTVKGWAIEGRLYAEDPYRDFLPSTGRLVRCRPPVESPRVRVDTGVVEGSEISLYYDPMIAKLITYGRDRAEAIAVMQNALDNYYVRGIGHNLSFLNAVLGHQRFQSGAIDTGFIAEEFPEGFSGAALSDAMTRVLLACAVLTQLRTFRRDRSISGQLSHYDPTLASDWVVTLGADDTSVTVSSIEDGFDIEAKGSVVAVRSHWRPGEPLFHGTIDGHEVTVQVDPSADGVRLSHRGAELRAVLRTHRAAELACLMPEKQPPDTSQFLLCPMPGQIIAIHVEAGDVVKQGQALAVVEAMKMENVLKAEKDAVIANIAASVGESLAVDAVILEFE